MKLPAPYVCDECGNQKKESNHWWVLLKGIPITGFVFPVGPDGKVPPATAMEFLSAYVLLPWGNGSEDTQAVRAHLCSESCAIKALSKWMASLQSANAGKLQPANEPTEERQKLEQNARRGYEKAFEPTDYNPK